MERVIKEATEFDGGYINKECPHCGQFCKLPKVYHASHKESYANSYCRRCKKKVKLSVEYL